MSEVKSFLSYFTVSGVRFDGEPHENNAGDGAIYDYRRDFSVVEPIEILGVNQVVPMKGWVLSEPTFCVEVELRNKLTDMFTSENDYLVVFRICGHDGLPNGLEMALQDQTEGVAPVTLTFKKSITEKQAVCFADLPMLSPASTVCTCLYVCVCLYVCISSCMHVGMLYACMYVCRASTVRTCLCDSCVNVCVCACICMYVFVHVCM
jgi:hypothetical protein